MLGLMYVEAIARLIADPTIQAKHQGTGTLQPDQVGPSAIIA